MIFLIVLVVLAAVIGSCALLWLLSDTIVGRWAGVRQPTAPEKEKLGVYVESICLSTGFQPPEVGIVDDEKFAALAYGKSRVGGKVAVTTGLLARFETTEIEAVMAHLLFRIYTGSARRGTILAVLRLAVFPVGMLVSALLHSPVSPLLADAEAVRVTRYPQGLIAALQRMERSVPESRRKLVLLRGLWMLDASHSGRHRSDVPLAERLTYLADFGHAEVMHAEAMHLEPGEKILLHSPRSG